jgi:hypothetical protein
MASPTLVDFLPQIRTINLVAHVPAQYLHDFLLEVPALAICPFLAWEPSRPETPHRKPHTTRLPPLDLRPWTVPQVALHCFLDFELAPSLSAANLLLCPVQARLLAPRFSVAGIPPELGVSEHPLLQALLVSLRTVPARLLNRTFPGRAAMIQMFI